MRFSTQLLKFFVFDRCMLGVAERMIVEEVSGEAREDVKRQFVKQIFDFLFHSGVSVGAVAMFGGTEWFPWVFGGGAECVDIFAAFPSWPRGSHQQMEGFVLFQLGVNLYLMLELTVLKRDYYRKFNFYELLLHHVVTCTLLVFATMNILPVAISILFLHDLSDALRALARLWVLSKWETRFHCASVGLDVVGLAGWVYLRVLAFPGCCINSFYFNYDKLDVFGMRPYYLFIMFLCLLLFSLHNFWTFLLAKSAYKRYQFRLKRAELSQGETQKKE